jgi:hypothetical protein
VDGFLARIIDGLTAGNLTVAQAYISDVTEPENREKSFGLIYRYRFRPWFFGRTRSIGSCRAPPAGYGDRPDAITHVDRPDYRSGYRRPPDPEAIPEHLGARGHHILRRWLVADRSHPVNSGRSTLSLWELCTKSVFMGRGTPPHLRRGGATAAG